MWMYDNTAKYLLFTPFEIFNNPTVYSLVWKIGIISGGLTTTLGMVEGIKRTLSMSYTPVRQVIIRYPIALLVSGMAPILFYYSAMGVNALVSGIFTLMTMATEGPMVYANKLHEFGDSIYLAFLSFFFLLAFGWYLFKGLLYHGVRWFGLLMNAIVTPFVMSLYIFDSYNHVFQNWLKDTYQKFAVQIAHSLFLGLIGVILFAPDVFGLEERMGGTFNYVFVKLLLSVGGLHTLLNPPQWVSGMMQGDSLKSWGQSIKTLGKLVIKRF